VGLGFGGGGWGGEGDNVWKYEEIEVKISCHLEVSLLKSGSLLMISLSCFGLSPETSSFR
jgi:hypothetical protein